MTLNPLAPAGAASASSPGAPIQTKDAETPAEAAKQFEAVLVRQFVEVLTKDLFKSEQGGMLTGQADLQRDTITNVLTDTLVETGSFGVAEMLTAQWDRTGMTPPAATPPTETPGAASGATPSGAAPAPAATPAAHGLYSDVPSATPSAPPRRGAPAREMTMDEALRMYAPQSSRAPSASAPAIDNRPDLP